jgi:sulfite dehydrogenase (cytochrome) subunit B
MRARMKSLLLGATILACSAASHALADEQEIACHSLDFIQMNSPFQDERGWQAYVNKMVTIMGAPIEEEDQKAIIAYLAANYGR